MLITPEYIKVLKDTHDGYKAKGKRWGVTAEKDHFFANTLNVIDRWKSKAVLDYGSGSSGLRMRMEKEFPDILVTDYEPSNGHCPPEPHDIVVCIDVLEHVEPELVDDVLLDLQRVMKVGGYISISCSLAIAILADGRNAHISIHPPEWWVEKIMKLFDVLHIIIPPGRGSVEFKLAKKSPGGL
jgi:hypothetical protein